LGREPSAFAASGGSPVGSIDQPVAQLSGRAADLLDNAEVKRAYLGG